MPAHLIGEGLILNLEKGKEWILGRDPEFSDFVIEDPAVSRKHGRFSTKLPEGFFLKNLSDSKSIYINGIEYESRNPDRILLKEGDQVQIGSHIFTFSEKEIPAQKRKKDVYDDIFGDLEEPAEPPPPPRKEKNEPSEEALEEERIEPKAEESDYNTIFDDAEA